MRRTLTTLSAVFGGILGSLLFVTVLAQPISNIIGTGDFRPLILMADGKHYFELTPAGELKIVTGSGATVTLPAGTAAPSGTVTSASIVDETIVSGDIFDGTIVAADIATSGVATAEILDGTILTGDIATGGVATANILDGTILNADMGTVWTTPTFAAGDFAANGSMTWTVEAGDVTTYQYVVQGKLMTVNFTIENGVIGGTPNTALTIKIPDSKIAVNRTRGAAWINENATYQAGAWSTTAGGTTIEVYRVTVGNWTAGNSLVYGSVTFEIQ